MSGKRITISIILILFVKVLMAGWQEEVDELKHQLDTVETDTMKIKYCIVIGDKFLPNIPDVAFEYYLKAKNIAKQINDSSFLAFTMFNICDYYMMVSEYKLALETASNALTLCKKDKRLLSLGHERMAEAYSFMEIFDKSLEHNRISLALEIERKDTLRIAKTLHLIGTYFLELDNFDSALHYLYKANAYNVLINGKPLSFDLSHLGHTYTYMGEYDSALHYHYQAYYYDSIRGDSYDLAVDEYYIAFTYYNSGHYDSARKYTNKCILRSEKLGLYETMLYCYELLYEMYEKQENYKEAFKYSVLKNAYTDTLHKKNKQSYVKGLEAKKKFEEQQKVLEATEQENILLEKQSQLMTILAIVGLLLLGSMFFIIVLISKRHQANRKLLNEVEKANMAKEKLISVISHDLRGLIGTIRNGLKYTLEDSLDYNSVKKIIRSFYVVVDSTYDLLENLLTWAQDSKENMDPSFVFVNLLEISEQSLAHTSHLANRKNIEIVNEINKISFEADKNMLLTILRNMFSNAIKFSPVDSKVELSSYTDGKYVDIVIKDNGIGISQDILNDIFSNKFTCMYTKGTMGERGSGLGLSICKSFIDKHHGEIWAESELGKGTTFHIRLPLKQKRFL